MSVIALCEVKVNHCGEVTNKQTFLQIKLRHLQVKNMKSKLCYITLVNVYVDLVVFTRTAGTS